MTDNRRVMQLADWFLSLLLITADDPHGRTPEAMTLPQPRAETPAGVRLANP